jgi:hypothetical protein
LAIAGDWRRLQRRMMSTPAEIQKRRFFMDLFGVLGMIINPYLGAILSRFPAEKQRGAEDFSISDGSRGHV